MKHLEILYTIQNSISTLLLGIVSSAQLWSASRVWWIFSDSTLWGIVQPLGPRCRICAHFFWALGCANSWQAPSSRCKELPCTWQGVCHINYVAMYYCCTESWRNSEPVVRTWDWEACVSHKQPNDSKWVTLSFLRLVKTCIISPAHPAQRVMLRDSNERLFSKDLWEMWIVLPVLLFLLT